MCVLGPHGCSSFEHNIKERGILLPWPSLLPRETARSCYVMLVLGLCNTAVGLARPMRMAASN